MSYPNYPQNKKCYSIPEQIKIVQIGFKTAVTLHSQWKVLSILWFNKWKEYVNYDNKGEDTREENLIASLHPGPIDNKCLLGNFGDELSRHVTEGKDFIIVPENVANCLEVSFPKCDFNFTRKAINFGSVTNPKYQVELYPTRCEFHQITESMIEPDMTKKPFILYSSRSDTLFARVYHTALYRCEQFRIWMKTTPKIYSTCDETNINSNDTNNNENEKIVSDDVYDNISISSISQTKTSKGRKFTQDITDVDGEWKLLRDIRTQNIPALLGERDCLELMIETKSYNYNCFFPREKILNKWKEDLRVGDMMDVLPKKENYSWREAKIVAIDNLISVKVHYMGYDDADDELFKYGAEFNKKCEPLYSKTLNWREKLEDNDAIEVKINGKWLQGKVKDTDYPHNRIEIEYDYEDNGIDTTGKDLTGTIDSTHVTIDVYDMGDTPPPLVPGDSTSVSCFNDDACDFDLYGGNGNRDVLAAAMEAEPMATTDDNFREQAVECTAIVAVSDVRDISRTSYDINDIKTITRSGSSKTIKMSIWVDIDSEEVCNMYTHLKKPVHKSTYNSTASSSYNDRYSTYNNSDAYDKNTSGTPVAVGAVGLKNLGNTCYMNSTLQCLMNSPALIKIFTSNVYKDQINKENVLGAGGQIAVSFGKLVKDMWSNSYNLVVPKEFKKIVGERFASFAGYDQQDSQEYLSELLGVLDEDLNRIAKKPHVPKTKSVGYSDDLIARESLRRTLLRNNSEIVDICFGQYKSHITCSECSHVSITFDPFSSLSLPIPVKNTKTLSVHVQLLPIESARLSVDIEVMNGDSVKVIKEKLIKKLINRGYLKDNHGHNSQDNKILKLSHDIDIHNESKVVNVDIDVNEDIEVTQSSSEAILPFSENFYNFIKTPSSITKQGIFNSNHESFFQLCTKSKNYSNNDAFIISNYETEIPVMYQLEVPCQIKHVYQSNIHLNPTFSYCIDICSSKTNTYKYITLSREARLAVTNNTTCYEIYNNVWKVMKSYFKLNSNHYNEAERGLFPFELAITPSYGGSTIKEKLPYSMELLKTVSRDKLYNSNDVIAILWKTGVLDSDSILEDGIRVITKVEEEASNDDSNDSPLNVYKCLDKYVEREQMIDTWYCCKCKNHVTPIKKLDLWSTPDMLILHLKRFSYVPGQYFVHREKINDTIDFPITGLDLTKYIKGDASKHPNYEAPIYDLYGVSLHSGGMGGGHYTAICQNPENKKWYKLDDSTVSESTPEAAIDGKAYVLFYKRRGAPMKYGGIIPTNDTDKLPNDEEI